MIHTIAYVSGGRVLTKCAKISDVTKSRAFGADCPECLQPDRWPSEAEQIAAKFHAAGSKGPFDKLAGRP